MLILTLDYYIAKIRHYMFKHNKLKEEEGKEEKKNIIIIYFITDKKEKNERSVMSWSERADKNGKRKQPKCIRRVGTAICTNLLSYWILNIFVILSIYLPGIRQTDRHTNTFISLKPKNMTCD